MAQSTVAQFAKELKLTEVLLIDQLKAAGVSKKASDDTLSEDDKTRLLTYLQEAHGHTDEKKKITLVRKQTSEIKKSDATGKARTIQVEVRKKRTFVKVDKAAEIVEPEKPVETTPQPILNEGEVAKRRAEEERQSALLAKQAEEKAKAPPKRRTKKDDEAPAVVEAAPLADAEAAPKKTVRRKTKGEETADGVAIKAEGAAAPAGAAVEVVPDNRPRIGERVVLKKEPAASEGTLHKPVLKPARKSKRKQSRNRSSPPPRGKTRWPSAVPSRRAAMPAAVAMAGAGARARIVMRMTTAQQTFRRQPSLSFAKCSCRKRLPLASSRRRWPSRQPKSSKS